jgi:hypothetical protein
LICLKEVSYVTHFNRPHLRDRWVCHRYFLKLSQSKKISILCHMRHDLIENMRIDFIESKD